MNAPSAVKPRAILKQLLRPAHGQMGAKIHQPIGPGEFLEFMPFLLLDDLETEGQNSGFGDHPHRGQETMTYVLEGSLLHQDSNGNKGILQVGDMQVMRAGSGIMHNETPIADPETNRTKGIQLWVALPEANLNDAAAYKDIQSAEYPVSSPAPGVDVKVVAGESFGASAPIWTRAPGAFVHVIEGNPSIAGSPGRPHETFFMKRDGEGVKIENQNADKARILLIAGDPLEGQEVHRIGPFVSTSSAGISDAILDFRMGSNGFERVSRWKSDTVH
ncbi:RmlC-like cupin domain-containing protein [Ilyonectria sp. MPI-CAGE-AT-0026]|nr:RmlC-like cupin domain-containing protein [Ilyonectria sp. MPI-CAGE-AT-0026]